VEVVVEGGERQSLLGYEQAQKIDGHLGEKGSWIVIYYFSSTQLYRVLTQLETYLNSFFGIINCCYVCIVASFKI
jgi:hypothetical protein